MKAMKKYLIMIVLAVVAVSTATAQTDRDCIRHGNRQYADNKFAEAEVEYRKAIALNPRNPRAIYNLGCALQKQGRDSDAVRQYEQAVKLEPNKKVRSQAYYNMGVAKQRTKDYGSAIEAYKNCLRLNPSDNDARYNYVLCKRQQQQQQSGSNNKNKNSDKNKNNNDKNKNNNNDKQNKKNQNKDKQQQNQNQQDGDLSRQNAEQMLQAAMNQEKQTDAKLKQAMQQPQRQQLDKNW